MNELFRFMLIRPPQATERVLPVDMGTIGTPLQRALIAAPAVGKERRQLLERSARTYLQQHGQATLITAANPLASAAKLDAILAAIRDGKSATDLATLRAVIQAQFGKAAEA